MIRIYGEKAREVRNHYYYFLFVPALEGNKVTRRGRASDEGLRVGRLKAGIGEIFLGAIGILETGCFSCSGS